MGAKQVSFIVFLVVSYLLLLFVFGRVVAGNSAVNAK